MNTLSTTKKIKVSSEAEYSTLMKQIDILMKKGENNLSSVELKRLRVMSEVAEAWEDTKFTFSVPRPKTLADMIFLKMYELKINQVALAKLLDIDTPKLSQILKGRRKPDIIFLKAIHKKLKIDAEFLLEKA